jgi:predicted ATP-dependent serine protease
MRQTVPREGHCETRLRNIGGGLLVPSQRRDLAVAVPCKSVARKYKLHKTTEICKTTDLVGEIRLRQILCFAEAIKRCRKWESYKVHVFYLLKRSQP